MGMLDGKVALVTGAGRGIGREEALQMAAAGCKIVVNDLGGHHYGTGAESKVADEVVAEIIKNGGEAIANYDSVTDYEKAKGMIDQAVAKWGKLDIVVNNAGFLRDKMIFNMDEKDWDGIMGVHLKGVFNLSRHFGGWLRQEMKAGKRTEKGRILNTSSFVGMFGNVGQSNYAAAKAGIAMFTNTISKELNKYATCNTIIPNAGTRMTIDSMPDPTGAAQRMNAKNKSGMVAMSPSHFPPLVIFLASDAAANINGHIFLCMADIVTVFKGFEVVKTINNNGAAFTPEILAERVESDLLKDFPKLKHIMEEYGKIYQR
jgi:NAD(P)-dependent dehydrogenase (short-subunit alcohol dehydrogenase family)